MNVKEFIKENKCFKDTGVIEIEDAISGKSFTGTTRMFKILCKEFPEWLNAKVIGSGHFGRTLQLDVICVEK